GDLQISTFGESPAGAHGDPNANNEAMKDMVMHARLSGQVTILASDDPSDMNPKNPGKYSLSIAGADAAVLTSCFEKLSENGKVAVPLSKQFWGATFGMVTDQFGVNWMVSIN
ncbi:MAG: VOC family protein, partial [Chitinophagaceae bacterium]